MRLLTALPVVVLLSAVVGCGAEGCGGGAPSPRLDPQAPPALPEPRDDDVDGDGTANDADDDVDGDGTPNNLDPDLDGDGAPNVGDDDVDGDGTPNADDETPFGTATGEEGPHGDLDGDGIPNSVDDDDDGDLRPDGAVGIGSCDGVTPAQDERTDCDGYCPGIEGGFVPCDDGAPPGTGRPDLDGDGIPDITDPDANGDGLPDVPPDEPPPPPPPPPPACVEQSFEVSASDVIPPRILLVVDKSGSMDAPAAGFGGRKWDAARAALVDVVNQATADFGLVLYPDGTADRDVCEPGALRVPVGTNTAPAIIATLTATQPGGGTPTATTLAEARQTMDALGTVGGTRAVVLATDGGPNCNGSLNPNTCTCVSGNQADCQALVENCLDDVNAVASASQVAAAGYPVFVIGIPGSENFVGVLNAMAQAGGTGQVFNASTSTALAQRIEAITQVLAGCRFTLQQPIAAGADVTVTVDGVAVSADAANGYTLVGDALELHGGSCDRVQQGAQAGATVIVRACEG